MFQWKTDSEPFEKGRHGIIFRCCSQAFEGEKKYVMKKFKKGKSNKTFIKEIDCQRAAAELGCAPKIIDFYIGGSERSKGAQSYIVMESCDQTVFNSIKSQKGSLTDEQWKEIESLYQKLDQCNVLHNDSNPHNLMIQFFPKRRFLLIDYGMSKRCKGNMSTCFPLMRDRLIREEKRVATKYNYPK